MKKLWFGKGTVLAALAGMAAWSSLAANNEPPNSASPAPLSETRTDAAKPAESSAQTQDTATLSTSTKDILKLVQAGVSTEVIRTYVENSPIAGPLTAADVIALKEKTVPDELIAMLIKRSAETTPAVRSTGASIATPQNYANAGGMMSAAPAYANGNAQGARLDPESYDYWWYHYAYPRSLAYANERVLSSYNVLNTTPFYGYGYGYAYPPLPYPPQNFSTFLHLRQSSMNRNLGR